MIDFSKPIKNSNKFRQAAMMFERTGKYCLYPNGTREHKAFWDEETDRCLKGYTAPDGDYITGYNYFYLNYCPIVRLVVTTTKDRKGDTVHTHTTEAAFPDFYDYDYYFFLAVKEAEDNGKHLSVLKSRRKGYSYKSSAMACRNFFLIRNSKTYIYGWYTYQSLGLYGLY